MNFELVIFDLDGVLADSTEAITKTFNGVLSKSADISVSNEKIVEMIGMPLDDMFEHCLPAKIKYKSGDCSATYRKIYGEVCVKWSKLYKGVAETLEYLKPKAVLTVATTKYSKEAEILLKGLGIRKYFKFVLGIDHVEKPKPHPEIINKLLNLTGSSKDKTAFVGDTTYDILAGRAAGVKTIAVTYGFQKKIMLIKSRPDFFIDSLPELKNIIR